MARSGHWCSRRFDPSARVEPFYTGFFPFHYEWSLEPSSFFGRCGLGSFSDASRALWTREMHRQLITSTWSMYDFFCVFLLRCWSCIPVQRHRRARSPLAWFFLLLVFWLNLRQGIQKDSLLAHLTMGVRPILAVYMCISRLIAFSLLVCTGACYVVATIVEVTVFHHP